MLITFDLVGEATVTAIEDFGSAFEGDRVPFLVDGVVLHDFEKLIIGSRKGLLLSWSWSFDGELASKILDRQSLRVGDER